MAYLLKFCRELLFCRCTSPPRDGALLYQIVQEYWGLLTVRSLKRNWHPGFARTSSVYKALKKRIIVTWWLAWISLRNPICGGPRLSGNRLIPVLTVGCKHTIKMSKIYSWFGNQGSQAPSMMCHYRRTFKTDQVSTDSEFQHQSWWNRCCFG